MALSTTLIWWSWLLIGLSPGVPRLPRRALGGLSVYDQWRNYAIANVCSIPSPILADYNAPVLRLLTLPNLLLTWLTLTTPTLLPRNQTHLDLPPSLIQTFKAALHTHHITLRFLAGPWCPALAARIPPSAPDMGTVILAAETIYSPESTEAFVALVCRLLRRGQMSKAMVAAKRVYFGVGGSVDGLKAACREHGAVASEIENHGVPGLEGGVGRALIEVQMY
ncbi:histidine protein methyltransferase 1-like [Teratosphaeria destructans]|uniref:Histidine protein methyltransferase 1-like n=1 Tax=Teratosphaeria destructans TaxID=418781 RepID=A0A9W7W0A3_9PEZI|nr:histidine protein methyltransferase 1-like [Teratosphaeria destructans]